MKYMFYSITINTDDEDITTQLNAFGTQGWRVLSYSSNQLEYSFLLAKDR